VALFQISTGSHSSVAVQINGREVCVPAGASVAAAALLAGAGPTRTSPVDGSPRAPFCMMGVCFECLMSIDGEPEVQACMVAARAGMVVDLPGVAGEKM
jgi:predicted molibdopterin-dependent oxidoreductase YjgC